MDKIIIFENIEYFNLCQNPLPSGQEIGEPVPSDDGFRVCICYDFVPMDMDYFATLEGVTIADTLPADWYIPEEE